MGPRLRKIQIRPGSRRHPIFQEAWPHNDKAEGLSINHCDFSIVPAAAARSHCPSLLLEGTVGDLGHLAHGGQPCSAAPSFCLSPSRNFWPPERHTHCQCSLDVGLRNAALRLSATIQDRERRLYFDTRSSRLRTEDAFHRPPRAEQIPRAFKLAAISRSVVRPVAWISRTIGSTLLAN